MKNLAFAASLVLLAFSMNAQVTYFDDQANHETILKNDAKYRNHLLANHITHIKAVSISSKHPQGMPRYEMWYDSRGNDTESIAYNKHGKVAYFAKRRFDDSNRLISYIEYRKNGKPKSGTLCTYDKWGNKTQCRVWWKDTGHITYSYTVQYNSRNNPVQYKSYSTHGKLYSSVVYEYYDDGSKKKTTMYNSKGKVTGVWNFDCNPIGKSQESKMKDTSKICVHYETDKNGNPVKIREEYTESGGLFKHRLRIISKYDKDNHLIELTRTKMNGKEVSHTTSAFDDKGNLTEYCDYVPGTKTLKKRWVYDYDSSGNMVQIVAYHNSSEAGSVTKYVYN